MRIIRVGLKGEDVKKLQILLGVKPDGFFGGLTLDAVEKFQRLNNLDDDGVVGPKTWSVLLSSEPAKQKKTVYERLVDKYGVPNKEGNDYLVNVNLPFPMKLEWNLGVNITRFKAHKKVAPTLEKIFQEIFDYYGLEKIQELGIDLFGGCFAYRNMRGGSSMSTHSWAISVDLDPKRNPLRGKWKDAEFSKPEYKEMIDIFYRNGYINLGKEKDFDSMHFEPKL